MLCLLWLLLLLGEGSPQEHPKFRLEVQEWVVVQEGLCTLVPCGIRYPRRGWNDSTPAYGYWYRVKDKSLVATNDPKKKSMDLKPHFQLLGDPGNNNCSLSISGAQKSDSGQYYFRLERGDVRYNYMHSLLTVIVTELTQTPDIHIPKPLQSGHLGHLTCSMPGACEPPTIFWTWYALRGPVGFSTSEIQLTPRPEDHGTRLTCQMTFSRDFGTQVFLERTVQLNVSYAPQKVKISVHRVLTPGDTDLESLGNISRLEVCQGQSLQLLCAADSQPPATLSWVLEDQGLSWSSPLSPGILRLELPTVKAGDSRRYTCQAENRLGSLQHTLALSVLYAPEDLRVTVSQANVTVLEILRNDTPLPVLEGQSLRLHCVTSSNPPAKLSWTWESQILSPTQPSDPGVLELPLVQREHEGEFTCTAQNPLGAQHISMSLFVHYPPQMPAPSCSWKVEGLHCSCSSRAWPPPTLHWRLGEGLLEGNSSNASFTVTFSTMGPWANSSLSLHKGLSASLGLSCEARNTYGAQSATLLLLPGTPRCPGASILAAVGASAAMAMLSLGACLVFLRMKRHRETASSSASTAASATEPAHLGLLTVSGSESKAICQPPVLATPTEGEDLELHYASLSFEKLRSKESQPCEESKSTVYAEIKTHR